MSNTTDELSQRITQFRDSFAAVESEIKRVIVGMNDVVRGALIGVCAGGHVLLEGVPGLGKTLLIKSIATTLGLRFKRIQFTPDLMPSDITGTQVLTEDAQGKRTFSFRPGPLFANIILADEINRATPKAQSALLEAMAERQVSVLGETYKLAEPFFVLATQNPIELEGTYPLPEAQLDRFLLKLLVPPPSSSELKEILNRTTGEHVPESRTIIPSESSTSHIETLKRLVREVAVAEPMKEVLVRILTALTPQHDKATKRVKEYVRFGPGPRGAQSLVMTAKVHALLDGRINIAFEDIKQALLPCLRHRILLNFQAEADGVTSDELIEEIRNAR